VRLAAESLAEAEELVAVARKALKVSFSLQLSRDLPSGR
jgi:hypothetical protein